MSNIHCLATRRNEQIAPPTRSEADEFIGEFYDWARNHGIDITTTEFKFNAATVLTVVQSLLHTRG